MFAILGMSVFSVQAGIRIGAKAGVNIANAAFNTSTFQTDNFTGFQIGPIVEFAGITGFGVDAAILYSQQGLKTKGAPIFAFEEKVSTLDIPVNLKLKLSLADKIGCYFSAGPYASFKIDDQTSVNQLRMQWENKKFGVGLNLGTGVELLKHLQVGVNYQIALNDDYSDFSFLSDIKNIKAKTRIWSLTAAYFF